MPSRRSHTKSHHGCVQCKTRRVKCDETTPQCQRCARRHMTCSFMEHGSTQYHNNNVSPKGQAATGHHRGLPHVAPAPTTVKSPGTGSASSPQDALQSPTPPGFPSQQRAFSHLDLELIHYYSTQTYMTLTSKLQAHLVWRDVIFQEGLKHDFLLSALMATAALHKATNHGEESEVHATYVKVAFSYQNAALAGYIPALNNPTKENAVALFILSALATIWLFGSKKLPTALNSITLSAQAGLLPYMAKSTSEHESTDFLEILTLIQGMNAIVKQTINWLWGSGIDPLLTPPQENELPPSAPDIEASLNKVMIVIEQLRHHQPELSAEEVKRRTDIYMERLRMLRHVSRARTVIQHDQQVFAWPVTSDPPFIELLRQRDFLAIILFIHWAACFKCLEHFWWAAGWSARLVTDASTYLDPRWDDVILWPRVQVGLG